MTDELRRAAYLRSLAEARTLVAEVKGRRHDHREGVECPVCTQAEEET